MTSPINELDGASFGMYDHYIPNMKAASYTLNIESTMTSRESGETFHHESRELAFVVDAPRFTLVTQEEIRSCSPPHGGDADYQRTLPHLVLDKRVLPWERSLDPALPTTNDRAIPWMTLVLLTNDEMVADGARTQEVRAGDLLHTESGILAPAITPIAGDQNEMITVLDISAKLFRAVCPRVTELRLLTHIRRVRVDEKHGDSGEQERDFAILMSNRLVQPGTNIMFLVSLEGWYRWLEDEASGANNGRLRVVVLYSWNFASNAGDGSFTAHVKKLDAGLLSDRVTLVDGADPAIRFMLAQGYTPIAYEPDGAAKTFAWYRGPLSPVYDAEFEADRIPFRSADDAMIIEEGSGILDVSLASAFQLGRLLALGSASFGSALRHWNHLKQLDALAKPQRDTEATSLVEEMARYAASHVLETAQSDETIDDVKRVSEWLVALRLLQPVPFRYLVPAANLLPAESLRFFYVDENWIDALTDGALSLGASSSSAQWFLQSKRGTLRQTLRIMMLASRNFQRNDAATTASADDNAPMCGFILRSSLLIRFPGLEVECLTSMPTTRKLHIARMDLIGGDLLLVVVLGKPDQVRLKLPRESLTFSHDEMGLRPRITRSTGTDLATRAQNSPPIVIKEYKRTDAFVEGVIDVRKLHDKLEGTQDNSGARFALHWLNGPDDALIRWEHVSERGLS